MPQFQYRYFSFLIFIFAMFLSCSKTDIVEGDEENILANKSPNILIILADDLGYVGLSCFGGEGISTPELDKLASNGVMSTNFHANSTVCSPTRVALMSGRYQQRVGLDHIYFHCVKDVGFDPKTNPSMPLLFKQAGYKTGVFGKWHLGSGPDFQPKAHGFDDFVGFLDGNIDFISKASFIFLADSDDRSFVVFAFSAFDSKVAMSSSTDEDISSVVLACSVAPSDICCDADAS